MVTSLVVSLFVGCTDPCIQPSFPHMERKSPTNLMWTDIKYNGMQVHMLTPHEWNYVQSELIESGMKANLCIDLANGYEKAK